MRGREREIETERKTDGQRDRWRHINTHTEADRQQDQNMFHLKKKYNGPAH